MFIQIKKFYCDIVASIHIILNDKTSQKLLEETEVNVDSWLLSWIFASVTVEVP
jgi:hypothetical protein